MTTLMINPCFWSSFSAQKLTTGTENIFVATREILWLSHWSLFALSFLYFPIVLIVTISQISDTSFQLKCFLPLVCHPYLPLMRVLLVGLHLVPGALCIPSTTSDGVLCQPGSEWSSSKTPSYQLLSQTTPVLTATDWVTWEVDSETAVKRNTL